MQQSWFINNSNQLNKFRSMITPIFRSAILCVTACGIMHRRCCRPATSWAHYSTSCNKQSSAPEDGRDHCPKHVVLVGIINKPLLLHPVGVYIIYVTDARSSKYQINILFVAMYVEYLRRGPIQKPSFKDKKNKYYITLRFCC